MVGARCRSRQTHRACAQSSKVQAARPTRSLQAGLARPPPRSSRRFLHMRHTHRIDLRRRGLPFSGPQRNAVNVSAITIAREKVRESAKQARQRWRIADRLSSSAVQSRATSQRTRGADARPGSRCRRGELPPFLCQCKPPRRGGRGTPPRLAQLLTLQAITPSKGVESLIG